MTQAAINVEIDARLKRLEEGYQTILLILRGRADEANGKDSVVGRLRTMESEQSVLAKEISKHLDFHMQIQKRVEEEQKERREFQQRMFFTLFAFLLSNIGLILLSLRYLGQLLTE